MKLDAQGLARALVSGAVEDCAVAVRLREITESIANDAAVRGDLAGVADAGATADGRSEKQTQRHNHESSCLHETKLPGRDGRWTQRCVK